MLLGHTLDVPNLALKSRRLQRVRLKTKRTTSRKAIVYVPGPRRCFILTFEMAWSWAYWPAASWLHVNSTVYNADNPMKNQKMFKIMECSYYILSVLYSYSSELDCLLMFIAIRLRLAKGVGTGNSSVIYARELGELLNSEVFKKLLVSSPNPCFEYTLDLPLTVPATKSWAAKWGTPARCCETSWADFPLWHQLPGYPHLHWLWWWWKTDCSCGPMAISTSWWHGTLDIL